METCKDSRYAIVFLTAVFSQHRSRSATSCTSEDTDLDESAVLGGRLSPMPGREVEIPRLNSQSWGFWGCPTVQQSLGRLVEGFGHCACVALCCVETP